ncbi:hypothetical protein [Bacteroides bouchesdurhonensis]
MINVIMHLTMTGCQWRILPKEFGWELSVVLFLIQ